MRTLLIVSVFAVPAFAHDLWLIPPATAKVDETITLLAHSGSDFPTGDHAPDPAKFARLRAVGPDGKDVPLAAAGTKDQSGLMTLKPAAAGVHVVSVQTTPKTITLAADKFNEYLVSDGLPAIYLLRSKEKTLDEPGVERYSKSPKALVRVGEGPTDAATKPLGLTLEIVPTRDPFALRPGDALPVKVLFRGEPLADANLGWAYPLEGTTPRGTIRTNKKGEALIPIAQGGPMTVRLTHMTRPKKDDHEWESFWTTLTWHAPK